jgi:hypothetical protein
MISEYVYSSAYGRDSAADRFAVLGALVVNGPNGDCQVASAGADFGSVDAPSARRYRTRSPTGALA